MKKDKENSKFTFLRHFYENLYGNRTRPLTELLLKSAPVGGTSHQDPSPGRKNHPFNFDEVIKFKRANAHHSTCIETKTESAVGLGFTTEKEKREKTAPQPAFPGGIQPPQQPKGVNKEETSQADRRLSKAENLLDPLCSISFQDVISSVCEDYWQTGNGYIEVVRDPSGKIAGLHHIPAKYVYINVEDDFYNMHYEILGQGLGNVFTSGDRAFAAYGDLDDFVGRKGVPNEARVSEVIHFRKPSSQSRWYGVPDWLAAVAAVELTQCLHQFQYDFFQNRAVPEFMLFLLGQNIGEENWEALTESLQANMGHGNSHKSLVMNITDANMKVQLEKLALDRGGEDSFKDLNDSLALEIVTAHRVPPLLAGIQIPGKLGAANEIVSTMKAFQSLVIGPAQKVFETTLNNTLGGDDGVDGLSRGDFEFRKITDEMEVEQMDTVSRMRQEFLAPENKDRDPKEGLKD